MKVAIMQPYFLPYLGYFQLLNAVDTFVLYDDVNFITRGWVNRNNLLLGGKAQLFTVPLQQASQNKLIYEVEVSNDTQWQKKLVKTIRQGYMKAPHFETVMPMLEKIISTKADNIASLCYHSITQITGYLDISTKIIPSSREFKNTHLKGQERILAICKNLQSDHYINPIGGQEIYDKALFNAEGITLNFIKSNTFPYPQFKNAFVPWLSIIDVLMFNSVEETKKLLLQFDLV